MIACCDGFSLPTAGNPGIPFKSSDRVSPPNPRSLPPGVWTPIDVKHPSVIVPLDTPTNVLEAYPGCAPEQTGTTVYDGAPVDAGGNLHLFAPGIWYVKNPGASAVRIKILDTYNVAAALFYGGIKASIVGGVSITSLTNGTFTPTHLTPIDVDSGADEEVLAAGTYRHLYFRNGSTGTQRLTITGAGISAVAGAGWNIGADPTGAKNGEILIFNNPDRMPVGPFRSIASADNALLEITHGS